MKVVISCEIEHVTTFPFISSFLDRESERLTAARAQVLFEMLRGGQISKLFFADYSIGNRAAALVGFQHRITKHRQDFFLERKDLWDPLVWMDIADPKLFLEEAIEDLIGRPDQYVYQNEPEPTR